MCPVPYPGITGEDLGNYYPIIIPKDLYNLWGGTCVLRKAAL